MDSRKKTWIAGALLALMAFSLIACGGTARVEAATLNGFEDVTRIGDAGDTAVDPVALDSALAGLPVAELTGAEVEGLLFMREEEKLARDVYTALYETWGLAIFQNIANSEQTHTDAVKTLLERYGLEDPASDTPSGVFENEALQDLYDQLVVEGRESLASALHIGAAIEEIDILDLEERLDLTDQADIQTVYENLMKGSRNHLRAFVSTLERQAGETYQPQYLDADAYDEIMASGVERGQGSNGQRGRQSGRQGGGNGRGN